MLSRPVRRPHVLRTHGRRLFIEGTPAEEMDAEKLRAFLVKALPHLKEAKLWKLAGEYRLSGEPYGRLNFRYYP